MNKIKMPKFDPAQIKMNNPIPYEGLAADCSKAATILGMPLRIFYHPLKIL